MPLKPTFSDGFMFTYLPLVESASPLVLLYVSVAVVLTPFLLSRCCRFKNSRQTRSVTAAAQHSVARVPRSTRYSSYLASASQGSTTQTSTTTSASSQGSYEHLRELRRYPYKNAVLPTKTSTYLELRRHSGHRARGMTMGQKVSGKI